MTASYIKVPGSGTAISEPPATSELNAISISPNPTTGKLRIDNYDLRIYDLRIYDLRIKDIQIFDISGVQLFSTQQTTLDVSHLPAGIYFVQIKTEKGIVTKKIVKL